MTDIAAIKARCECRHQTEIDALVAANDRLEDALTEVNAVCARHYDRVQELERKLELAQAAQQVLNRAFG